MGSDEQKVRVQKFFREWTDDYDQSQYASTGFIGTRHKVVVGKVREFGGSGGLRLLEVGCGPGHLVANLSGCGFRCTAVDTSVPMIGLARRRANSAGPKERTKFLAADIEQLPFPSESFDVVVSAGVMEYLPGPRKAMDELIRVAVRGGIAVLPTTSAWSLSAPLTALSDVVRKHTGLLKWVNKVISSVGGREIPERPFPVRRDNPNKFRQSLMDVGFEIIDERFIYLAPPYPLDRLFPKITQLIVRATDSLTKTLAGKLCEGYVVVCRKK